MFYSVSTVPGAVLEISLTFFFKCPKNNHAGIFDAADYCTA